MCKIEVKLLDSMGSDLSVVNAARVSFGKKRDALGFYAHGTTMADANIPIIHDTDKKLIKYLAKHKHTSPFGHCFTSFHVKCPIFVSRQLVKHKYLRINEISRRYVKTEPDIFYPDWWREQAADKKQGSGDRLGDDEANVVLSNIMAHSAKSVMLYNKFLSRGLCEEQARMVLPLNMMTEFWWSGSLDAFANMCVLRCAEDSQQETRTVANSISHEMGKLYPESWAALMKTE